MSSTGDVAALADTDYGNASAKMPISYLQEICTRRTLAPDYELLSTEGQSHEAIFIYRVSVLDTSAIGQSKNKRKAKHLAAKSLLERIVAVGRFKEFGIGDTKEEAIQTLRKLGDVAFDVGAEAAGPGVQSRQDGDTEDNPVGKLQQVCQQRRLPAPTYEVIDEGGSSNAFVIQVILVKFSAKGSGQNKRLAKRDAAIKMLKILEKIPPENQRATIGLTEEDDLAEIGGSQTIIEKPFAELDEHFSSMGFVDNLKSAGEKRALKSLKELDLAKEVPGEKHVALLKQIGEEENWEPEYYPLKQLAQTGEHLCLVQLNTMPVAVCHGRGNKAQQACHSAAYHALEYLKLTTK